MMRGMVGAILPVALATLLGATSMEPAHAQDVIPAPAAVMQRIDQADAKRREAAAQDAEWLETGALVEAARQAMERGELSPAMELADAALVQAELALEQAQREASAWRERVVR